MCTLLYIVIVSPSQLQLQFKEKYALVWVNHSAMPRYFDRQSVVPPWHMDKGLFWISSVDAGSISGGGEMFELDQFASRLFDTLCSTID